MPTDDNKETLDRIIRPVQERDGLTLERRSFSPHTGDNEWREISQRNLQSQLGYLATCVNGENATTLEFDDSREYPMVFVKYDGGCGCCSGPMGVEYRVATSTERGSNWNLAKL